MSFQQQQQQPQQRQPQMINSGRPPLPPSGMAHKAQQQISVPPQQQAQIQTQRATMPQQAQGQQAPVQNLNSNNLVRQSTGLPPSSSLIMGGGIGTASSAIEQLKKHADTMALQEQNAASKVKELTKRLELVEKDKKSAEEQLKAEQIKVAEMQAQHQEDMKQFEKASQKMDFLFKQQAALEEQLQAAKQTLSDGDSNASEMSDQWRLQEDEVKDLASKFDELGEASARLQGELETTRKQLLEAEVARQTAQDEGADCARRLQEVQKEHKILASEAENLRQKLQAAETLARDAKTLQTKAEEQTAVQTKLLEVTKEAGEKLQDRVAELDKMLNLELQKSIDTARLMSQLRAESEDLKEKLTEGIQKGLQQDAEINSLRGELQNKHMMVSSLEQSVSELQIEKSALACERDEALSSKDQAAVVFQEEKLDMSAKISDLRSELCDKEKAIGELKEVSQRAADTHSKALAALQASLTQAEAAAKTASTVSTREAARQADLAATRDQVKHLTNALQSANKDKLEQEVRSKQLTSELEALRCSSAGSASELVEVKAALESLQKQVQLDRQEALKQAQEQQAAQQRAALESQSEVERLRKQVKEARAEAEAAEEAIKVKSKQLLLDTEQHAEQVERLKEALAKSQAEAQDTSTTMAQKLQDAETQIQQLKVLEEELAQERLTAKDSGQRSKEAAQELSKLRIESAKLKAEAESLRSRADSLEKSERLALISSESALKEAAAAVAALETEKAKAERMLQEKEAAEARARVAEADALAVKNEMREQDNPAAALSKKQKKQIDPLGHPSTQEHDKKAAAATVAPAPSLKRKAVTPAASAVSPPALSDHKAGETVPQDLDRRKGGAPQKALSSVFGNVDNDEDEDWIHQGSGNAALRLQPTAKKPSRGEINGGSTSPASLKRGLMASGDEDPEEDWIMTQRPSFSQKPVSDTLPSQKRQQLLQGAGNQPFSQGDNEAEEVMAEEEDDEDQLEPRGGRKPSGMRPTITRTVRAPQQPAVQPKAQLPKPKLARKEDIFGMDEDDDEMMPLGSQQQQQQLPLSQITQADKGGNLKVPSAAPGAAGKSISSRMVAPPPVSSRLSMMSATQQPPDDDDHDADVMRPPPARAPSAPSRGKGNARVLTAPKAAVNATPLKKPASGNRQKPAVMATPTRAPSPAQAPPQSPSDWF